MRSTIASLVALTVALLAAACSAPETPEAWTVERQADASPADATSVCRDVEAAALGGVSEHTDLETAVGELSRLAALLGATDALPALDRLRDPADAPDDTAEVDVGVELTIAATALDDAAWAICDVPLFTAVYASTSFADCHGELALAVNAYIAAPDPDVRVCRDDGVPDFLPCWQTTEEGYLPVDCRTGDIVAVDDGAWADAGSPRATTTTTTTTTAAPPTTTTVDPTIVPRPGAPGCAEVAELFVGRDPLRGDETDLPRLGAVARGLDGGVVELVDAFSRATTDAAPLEVVEEIVVALDEATIEACGLPLISASVALGGGVDALPCWLPTGEAYPAYAPTRCGEA